MGHAIYDVSVPMTAPLPIPKIFMPIDQRIIYIAFIFMGLDIVSGLVKAAKEHDIRSEKLREGLWHKLGFILAIIAGYLVEYLMSVIDTSQLGFTVKVPIMLTICGYIILTELVSVFENISKISPELKDKLGKLIHVTDDM